MVLLWAVVARGGPGVEEWIWFTSHRRAQVWARSAMSQFDWVTLLPPEVYGSGLGRRR